MNAPDRRYTPADPPPVEITRPAWQHVGAHFLLAVMAATYGALLAGWLLGEIR
jgi:hypothetical protein